MRIFEPVDILRVLIEHDVHFVVIGGIAANLLGSTTVTRDLDIMYRRDKQDLENLASALAALGAQPRGADPPLPFKLDAQALRNGSNFTLTTRLGDLDCLGEATGRFSYEAIESSSESMMVEELELHVVSLDDLIRMKRATGRTKDLIEVENLSALREVRDARNKKKR